MKPKALDVFKIRPTRVNNYTLARIEVDLRHVNYGLDANKNYRKKARSHFTVEDIGAFIESLDGLELEFSSDTEYEYFVVEKDFFANGNIFRIVFCIEKKEKLTAGIITLFMTRKSL